MLDSHKEQTLSARVAFATPLPTGLTKKNPSADKAPSVQHPSHQRHRHRHHHDHYRTNHVRHAFNPPHQKSQFTPHRSQQHLLSSLTRYGTTPMTSSTTTMAMAVTPSSDQAKEALSSSGGAMLYGLDVDFVTPSVRISSKREDGDVLDTTELLIIPESLLLTAKYEQHWPMHTRR